MAGPAAEQAAARPDDRRRGFRRTRRLPMRTPRSRRLHEHEDCGFEPDIVKLASNCMSFFDTSRRLVFAHRGGCALGPENTIAAFDRGLAAGADGLELDVHLSADGVVVVCHDDTLERTTSGRGPVGARTAAELAAVDAGCRFSDGRGSYPFRDRGVGVPALREVLRRYPGVPIIVEMKVDSAAMGHALVEDVRAADAV